MSVIDYAVEEVGNHYRRAVYLKADDIGYLLKVPEKQPFTIFVEPETGATMTVEVTFSTKATVDAEIAAKKANPVAPDKAKWVEQTDIGDATDAKYVTESVSCTAIRIKATGGNGNGGVMYSPTT